MRISDWSSDVCSSDLVVRQIRRRIGLAGRPDQGNPLDPVVASGIEKFDAQRIALESRHPGDARSCRDGGRSSVRGRFRRATRDRKSVVEGKSGSVRVVLGGRRIIKKKNKNKKE